MAQRQPTSPQPTLEIVATDAAVVASDPISRAIHRPRVPTRTQLLAEHQGAAMALRADRAKFAITKAMEVHDHASSEATTSLLVSKHHERGFAEGELSEAEHGFYASSRHRIIADVATIAAETGQDLRVMARDGELPSTGASEWDVLMRKLQTR